MYWRRRIVVLAVLLLVIFAITRIGGGDDSKASVKPASSDTKSQLTVVPDHVGAEETPAGDNSPSAAVSPAAVTPAVTPTPTPTPTVVPLPEPTGRCSDADVDADVRVATAEATRPVAMRLILKTTVQLACTWEFNARAVQVQVTSGSDRIWTTLECPKALPKKALTLRRDTPVEFTINWNSRRSDSTCSNRTGWAKPGYYRAQVAALGGEPDTVQFKLVRPGALPAKPKPKPTPTQTTRANPTPASTTPARSEPASTPRIVD